MNNLELNETNDILENADNYRYLSLNHDFSKKLIIYSSFVELSWEKCTTLLIETYYQEKFLNIMLTDSKDMKLEANEELMKNLIWNKIGHYNTFKKGFRLPEENFKTLTIMSNYFNMKARSFLGLIIEHNLSKLLMGLQVCK